MNHVPFSLPYVRDERFVGRTIELEQIHAALQRSDVVVVRTSGEGMGTTALAIEYAHRYRKFYGQVVGRVFKEEQWWNHRRNRHPAGQFMPSQQPQQATNLEIVIGGTRILKGTSGEKSKQIFTACNYELSIEYPTVDVGPLNPREAFAVLGALADRDPTGAKKLVDVTCGVPLALRLVIAVLRASRERRIRDAVSFFTSDEGTSIPWALDRAFQFSWETVEEENARRILQLLSLFPARAGVSMAQIVNWLTPMREDPSLTETNVSLLLQKKLLEECGDGKVSMHPRIAKLVAATVENIEEFLLGCESNLTERLRDLDWLEDEVDSRGANAVGEDIRALHHTLYHHNVHSPHDDCTRAITALLECVTNRGKHAGRHRTLFLQQMAASNLEPHYDRQDYKRLAALAQQRLEERGEPRFEWVHGQTSEQGRRSVSWNRIAFCGDDHHALTVANDGRVAVWDIHRGEIVEERSLSVQSHEPAAMANVGLPTLFHRPPVIAPLGLVVAGVTNHGVELWDLTDGASLGIVNRQAEFALTPNGRYLACMYQGDRGDAVLVRYDLAQATPPPQTVIDRRMGAGGNDILEPSLDSEARRIAVTNDGGRVLIRLGGDRLFIWEPASAKGNVVAFNDERRHNELAWRTNRRDGSASLVLSPRGRFAVTIENCRMYVWDLYPNVRGRLFVELDEPDQWPPPSFQIAVSDEFVVVSHEDILRIHALESGKLLSIMPIAGRYGHSRSNGPSIAVSRNDSALMIATSAPLFLRWMHPRN